MFGAKAHQPIIDQETVGICMAEGFSLHRIPPHGHDLLDLGLSRLDKLGAKATGELTRGQPGRLACAAAF